MREATNIYLNLSNQPKFRLNETNKMKDYFNVEIQERKIISKKLSKYIAAFDYFGKTLIVLSATSGGVSIEIASASFSLIFSLTTGITKMLKITGNKKRKHNKIVMLAGSKLNSIEKLISQALIDFEISHEEYKSIISEEENFRRLKGNIRIMKRDDQTKELKTIKIL